MRLRAWRIIFKKMAGNTDKALQFAPKQLECTTSLFLSKDLHPNTSLGQLNQVGVNPIENLPTNTIVKLVALKQVDSDELWLGLHNFYVITRYNHSPLYAMAAHQLSQEIKQRR